MSDQKTTSRLARTDPIVFVVGALLAVLVVIGGLTLVALAQRDPATAPPHHMAAAHVVARAQRGQLKVLVGDYWFKPSARRLRAGTYRFVAHNYGGVGHDVMVERTPIKLAAPGAPIDEAAPYGVDGLEPGTTKSIEIMLTPGRWEIFCSVAGHYQAGQHQILTVYGHMPRGMNPPKPMRDMG